MLTVDMVAEIPDAQGASLDVGFCCVGESYHLAWKRVYLQRQEDGTYIQTVTFPLDLDMDLELRLEDDTVLFSSASIAAMLPLQLKHGGVSWHYDSKQQIFYQTDWSVELVDPEGETVQGRNGEFRVYRNGILAFTGQEMQDGYSVEVDGEVVDNVHLPCASGDRIRLCYACTDAFGLQYEFPLAELLAMRWDDMEESPLSRTPNVDWPQ